MQMTRYFRSHPHTFSSHIQHAGYVCSIITDVMSALQSIVMLMFVTVIAVVFYVLFFLLVCLLHMHVLVSAGSRVIANICGVTWRHECLMSC